jgi:adenylate cyclase
MNLASRLEGVNKVYGTHICISEVIQEKVSNVFESRFLDKIRVKGKTQPIKIFELIGEK